MKTKTHLKAGTWSPGVTDTAEECIDNCISIGEGPKPYCQEICLAGDWFKDNVGGDGLTGGGKKKGKRKGKKKGKRKGKGKKCGHS